MRDDAASDAIATRANRAAVRLDAWIERTLSTRPLMAKFLPIDPSTASDLPTLADEFAALQRELVVPFGLDEQLLSGMLAAYELQARVALGETVAWIEQVRTYLGIEIDEIPDDRLQCLADDLGNALDAAGFSGDLADATAAWSEACRVPAERMTEAAEGYLADARHRSELLLGGLPDGTEIQLEIVHDVFYNGYNEYLGHHRGECRLNGDLPWTFAQLRHTVAHEAFPGHHAISSIREAMGARGELPEAAALYYARTPLTPIIEGTCEIANRMLDWEWSEDDDVYEHLNRYRKAVMTNVSIAVHRDHMPREEAIYVLESAALAPRSWAEARWTFLTHPLWCTSFPHYWFGTETVRQAAERLDAAGMGHRILELTHHRPHDVATFQLSLDRMLSAAGDGGGGAP